VRVGDTGPGRSDDDSRGGAHRPEPTPSGPSFAGDPVREIVSSIVDLVPTSDWALALFAADGGIDRFVSSDAGLDEAWWMRRTPVRPRAHAGYRVTPILHGLGRYGSGITLTFGARRTEFAALTLLRTP